MARKFLMKKTLFISILLVMSVTCVMSTARAYLIKGAEGEIDAVEVRINGRQYILLTDICKVHGIEWEWDSVSRKISLRKNGQEATFLVGSKYYYDGKKVTKLSAPVRLKGGYVFVPLKFSKYTVKRLFGLEKRYARVPAPKTVTAPKRTKAKEPSKNRFKIKKIVVDPGHGGKDPGAIGRSGLYEKNVVLDVSRRIKRELEGKGIDVVMTRDSDKFISLGGRARIANEKDADFFVSIHANANKRRWISGFEAYYLSEATDDNARAIEAAENSVLKYEEGSIGKHTKDLDATLWDIEFTENRRESMELAGFICQEVGRRLRLKNNDIKGARFYVLKGAEMPSVLVELSYLSNSRDEKNLKKDSYKQKLAEGVARGILAYKGEYERTNGFSQ